MKVTKILSIIFLLASIGLGFYLVNSVKSTMDDRALIAEREAAIIKKLQFIREAEIVYLEVNGNYTSDWDKLIDFIENGRFPIVQKKERIVTLSYGADSSIITYDTLGIISAKERIFNTNHNVNAANDGIFVRFENSLGDYAVKGAPAYVLIQGGKEVTHKYKESGKITGLENVQSGQNIGKGTLLMTLTETRFDTKMDLSKLSLVPGLEEERVKFEIYADEIERSTQLVDVIEVRNPKPFDPTRSEDNESKNKKPLRFGSKTDVTTSGNWE